MLLILAIYCILDCSAAKCPLAECITEWSYNDVQQLPCDNPDNSRDLWCPTELENGNYRVGSGKFKYCLPCVHGEWSSWGPYGACSKTCGGGTKRRTRECTNPAPSNGGSDCSGSGTENRSCNTEACSVLVSNIGEDVCSSTRPCRMCEGDCDYDDQCAGNLKCFQRAGNDTTDFGCGSTGLREGYDYCYEPAYASGSARELLEQEEAGVAGGIPSVGIATFLFCVIAIAGVSGMYLYRRKKTERRKTESKKTDGDTWQGPVRKSDRPSIEGGRGTGVFVSSERF
eukprot:GEMP01054883.1.p1 GENE.GEMP01054883.1~~GEMP01054883.1.p1  ORF type:complete len:285 (+),score=29.30 GEMP01054883.1:56-910(+)